VIGNGDHRGLLVSSRQAYQHAPGSGLAKFRVPAAGDGFYGLDLYGLWNASQSVIAILDRLNPAAAARARKRYHCFEGFRKDVQIYGRTVAAHPARSCRSQAGEQLRDLETMTAREADDLPAARREELFSAVQSARAVKNGEEYYRTLYRGGLSSWNLRDRHMADTLDGLARFLAAQEKPPKIVVWAHNTHLGDARVTQMSESGELNIGQLMRQRHDGDTVLVGFSTYKGTVTAAGAWGDETQAVTPLRR
jgi:erythromycin esterase-like protein